MGKPNIQTQSIEKDGIVFHELVPDSIMTKSLFYLGDEQLRPGITFVHMYDRKQEEVLKNLTLWIGEHSYFTRSASSKAKKKTGKRVDINNKDSKMQDSTARYLFARAKP